MSHVIPHAVAVVARVLIGLVLILAGASKLRSRRWPALALEMGTPRIVVLVLPAFETLLGMALVIQLGRPVTAWVAVGLFCAFTLVVAVQFVSGSQAPCNCFGGKEEQAVNAMTILRNVGLVALALLATA